MVRCVMDGEWRMTTQNVPVNDHCVLVVLLGVRSCHVSVQTVVAAKRGSCWAESGLLHGHEVSLVALSPSYVVGVHCPPRAANSNCWYRSTPRSAILFCLFNLKCWTDCCRGLVGSTVVEYGTA